MAKSSKESVGLDYLRLLVMGAPKVGKTTACVATAPGPVYLINSDDEYSWRPAAKAGAEFQYETVLGSDPNQIDRVIREIQKGVKEGTIRTVVWDTITRYSSRAADVYAAASANAKGDPDGRRFWPAHRKHVLGIVDRLIALPCHVIITAHHMDKYRDFEGNAQPVREGIVPALEGRLSEAVPAVLSDIIYLDRIGEERFFLTSSQGVYGPRGRNIPANVHKVGPSIQALLDVMYPPKKPE